MKPDFYHKVEEFAEYYNDLKFSPLLLIILGEVRKYLHPYDCVVDAGGGTGVFSQKLSKSIQGLKITLIEPCKESIEIAETILPQDAIFINDEIHTSLPLIGNEQNAFLFIRSLFAMVNSKEALDLLIKEINPKLKSKGKIIVFDAFERHRLNSNEAHLLRNFEFPKGNSNESFEKFIQFQLKLKNDLLKGLDEGIFYLFKEEELTDVFRQNNFNSLVYKKYGNKYFVVFEKYD